MQVNYQIVIDTLCSLLLVGFPIALIFVIFDRISDIFLSFISGKGKSVNL